VSGRPQLCGEILQRRKLGVSAEHRLDHPAVGGRELVGADFVGADPVGDGAGELAKVARDDGDPGAAGTHRPRERARSGVEGDPVSKHCFDHAFRQAAQQRDALAQGRLEGDLAAHRPLGDPGDMRADADKGRKLVDAFLPDQGRIHVGHDEFLLPARRALLFDGSGENEVGRDALVEPAAALDPAEG